jgi:hypothetical protein
MSSVVNIYTVHASPGGQPANVRLEAHGFCWPAFLLGPLWLTARRLWLAGALALLFDIAVLGAVAKNMLPVEFGVVALALGAFLIGLEAREWRRRALARRGAPLVGVAVGATETEALLHALGALQAAESQS